VKLARNTALAVVLSFSTAAGTGLAADYGDDSGAGSVERERVEKRNHHRHRSSDGAERQQFRHEFRHQRGAHGQSGAMADHRHKHWRGAGRSGRGG